MYNLKISSLERYPRMHLLLCTLYLARAIQASPTANTTTTSMDSVGAPSFTNRTMWSIVSSSALTLFACIYSAIHPNIPSPRDGLLRILWRRIGMVIMALIAPELIATWAIRQRLCARSLTERFKDSGHFSSRHPQDRSDNNECADVPEEQYELQVKDEDRESTQTLVAHAQGYEGTPRGSAAERCKKWLKAWISEESEDYAWTDTHSFFVLMGGFMLYFEGKPYHTLSPDQLLDMIKNGSISAPILSAKQIHDKSKGNAISKGLVILQVAWFVLQLISRAIYHLETTQLETGTLAFAVLSFITYAAWWNKPLNVRCPHPVYWTSTKSKLEMYDFDDDYLVDGIADKPKIVQIFRSTFITLFELLALDDDNFTHEKLQVPMFDGSIRVDDLNKNILIISGFFMATIFGGIHCIAWFFAFPTYPEQVLWHISAVAIIAVPWFGLFFVFLSTTFPENSVLQDLMLWITVFMPPPLYITGRIILLVLMATTLRNLRPDAYQTMLWTSLVPHL
ncbi:hypothetical protein K503DRAFT_869382 [Rhizopogon vinicolor AM-OR11-026]|uniref:Transmembrane protein n=1 Tax=Rhizopogon vinicolor AM-OR11-026 TaxID=1314800 RepID=A0A1B7MM80_9AGAM|nr:hypothetical protein K503DRAFT_869382 [Rhizopogon vinicolor AM-OR11-026]